MSSEEKKMFDEILRVGKARLKSGRECMVGRTIWHCRAESCSEDPCFPKLHTGNRVTVYDHEW